MIQEALVIKKITVVTSNCTCTQMEYHFYLTYFKLDTQPFNHKFTTHFSSFICLRSATVFRLNLLARNPFLLPNSLQF